MGNCQRSTDILPAEYSSRTLTPPARVHLRRASAGDARPLPLPLLPLSLEVIAKEFASDGPSGSSGGSGGSMGSAGARLTATRRQMILEVHRRQVKVCELQDALARERRLVDDLCCALAIG